jgi:hypothetical protein
MNWNEIKEQFPMERGNMTTEQEIAFVDVCYEAYEAEGFSDVFSSPYSEDHIGDKFTVIGRVSPHKEEQPEKYLADLETLPLWIIRFEDGSEMAAYPEEIIPSEIKQFS